MSLLLLALPVSVFAQPWTLTWTNPSGGQTIVDTTFFGCDGGPPIHQLQYIRLWLQPASGGPAKIVSTVPAIGREGLTEAVAGLMEAGHYWVVAWNPIGPSCASLQVYLGGITAVPIGATLTAITKIRYFDVLGRTVNRIGTSGIYWKVAWHRDGSRTITKIVHLK